MGGYRVMWDDCIRAAQLMSILILSYLEMNQSVNPFKRMILLSIGTPDRVVFAHVNW